MTKFFFTEDEFSFDIDIVEFKRILSQNDFTKFNSYFENGKYKFESTISIGVGMINYQGVGISSIAKLTEEKGKTVLNLKSSERPEYIIIILAFIVVFIAVCVKDFGISLLWTTVLFVVMFFWFKGIIQSQEQDLHQNIKMYFWKLIVERNRN
jgi:hypothetical protein